jgi:hypothetical protein
MVITASVNTKDCILFFAVIANAAVTFSNFDLIINEPAQSKKYTRIAISYKAGALIISYAKHR